MYNPPLQPEEQEIGELINRRRRSIAVHSFLYYHLSESIISDHLFDKWSKELVDLQAKYPAIAEKVTYQANYFRGWDGSSGYDLPADEYAVSNARRLLKYGYSVTDELLLDTTAETPFRLEDYLKTDEDWDRYAEALSDELNRNTPPPK